MRDKQYYPTPEKVIELMLDPFEDKEEHRYYREKYADFNDRYILEPSAGEGAILDYMNEHGVKNTRMYAIEIDDDFKHTLSNKQYTVVGHDFLQFEPEMLFDFIIMNPPFNEGAKHLLKAWEILYKGDIICLLNKETLSNDYSKDRKKLNAIIEEHGSVEEIGTAFTDAPIPAMVDVVIVRLHKEEKNNFFKDTSFRQEKTPDLDFNMSDIENKVATRSTVQNLIQQKNKAQEAFKELIEAYLRLQFYFFPLKNSYEETAKVVGEILGEHGIDPQQMYNSFAVVVKSRAWYKILDDDEIQTIMTNRLQQNFRSFLQAQAAMAFTEENIFRVIEMILVNRFNILDQAVIDVFDMMTKYHKDNKVDEGWKTNDSYKVNRKVIIPYGVNFGDYLSATQIKEWGAKFRLSWSDTDIMDIDKVMAYISGTKYNHIRTIRASLEQRFREIGNIKPGEKFDNVVDSTFFTIKFWKKGTLHLFFKDEKLWQYFNEAAAKGKNWLPPGEEPKNPYKETTPIKKQLAPTLF